MAPHYLYREKDSEKITKTTQRVEALADGIFSIILTLMVFDLRVPALPKGAEADPLLLANAIVSLWPQGLTFIFSFSMLGIFWMGHRSHMDKIERTNRPYEFLNILFFFSVSLIPLGAITMSKYPFNHTAILFFALIILISGMVFLLKWQYAVKHELVYSFLSSDRLMGVLKRTAVNPICAVLAMLCSFVDFRLAYFFFALPVLYYVFPEHIEHRMEQIAGHSRKIRADLSRI